jgi:hypothetical protein
VKKVCLIVETFKASNVLDAIFRTMDVLAVDGLNFGLIVALKPFAALKWLHATRRITHKALDGCCWREV